MNTLTPVSPFDVAAYIVAKLNTGVSHMKLHKLLYYCQAWSLVWDGAVMFNGRIEAWRHGPVVPEVYNYFKGQFEIMSIPNGDQSKLCEDFQMTIDSVIQYYGDKSPGYLSDLTHDEKPWKEARGPIDPMEPSTAEITHASMAEYYSGLNSNV